MDYLPSETVRLAQVLLPTRTLFEMETGFVNQEGRIQFSPLVYRGGTSISQISAGNHPPRLFRSDIPGGEPEPAWVMMAKLANAMSLPGRERFPLSRSELWAWIAKEVPVFANVQFADGKSDNMRIDLGRGKEKPFSSDSRIPSEKERRGDGELELLFTDWTFGSEELSTYSKYIQQVEKGPCLFMHPIDASRTGAKDKEKITLDLDGGPLVVELRVVDNMASGVIILPRHRQLQWQKMEGWPPKVGVDLIRK
jgi:NADH-quinone oxidoreductase subunit G